MAERLGRFDAALVRLGGRYQGTGLTTEGRIHYRKFLENVIAGEKQSLSDQITNLTGYNCNYQGPSCLDQLRQGGLVLPNYTNQGPLRGLWHAIMVSSAVEDKSDQEVRWAQYWGRNRLVAIIHTAIARSTNSIIVGTPDRLRQGSLEIMKVLKKHQQAVGLYPEGKPSKKLGRVTKGANDLIAWTARNNLPIITASCWSDGWDLNINFQSLAPKEVLGSQNGNPDAAGENVMLAILSQLPATVK